MKRRLLFFVGLLCLVSPAIGRAQTVNFDPQKHTLTVTVRHTLDADAEVALLEIGYANYGSTHKQVYKENVDASNKIIQALLSAGVPKDKIETGALEVSGGGRYAYEESPKGREFRGYQQWTVQVRASEAQSIVDIAVGAGANHVGDVQWAVEDPAALEARANDAALVKAQVLAQQMAKSLGIKLGQLVSVMNFTPSEYEFLRKVAAGGGGGVAAAMVSRPPETEMQLRLLPQKVKHEATVYVVYAFQP